LLEKCWTAVQAEKAKVEQQNAEENIEGNTQEDTPPSCEQGWGR